MKQIQRETWKVIYYFQTLTMPYFSNLHRIWYTNNNGKMVKTLPVNITKVLTPLALAHWIMGDGSFDGHRRGKGRVV